MTRFPYKVVILGLLLAGCAPVNKDLSQNSRYKTAMGKTYITKMDYVIYKFKGSKIVYIEEPGDLQTIPPLEKIHPPFPIKYYNSIILGLLPSGTELRTVGVREIGSTGNSYTYLFMEITKCADPSWQTKVVSPTGMTHYDRHKDPVPRFDLKYVTEISPNP